MPLHPSPPPSILSTLCRLALSQAGSHTGETGHHSPCPDWKHNVFVQILNTYLSMLYIAFVFIVFFALIVQIHDIERRQGITPPALIGPCLPQGPEGHPTIVKKYDAPIIKGI